MRISSSQYFTMNVETMSNQQASLANMYAQISSGKALQTAADNPLGAAQAVALTAQAPTSRNTRPTRRLRRPRCSRKTPRSPA
jgi:flagellin-like hook-associated protein FlgL